MEKVKVLFLCNQNSARSQIAEGLLRHFYGSKYDAFSAGASPTRVNPLAAKVMAEIGIDISGHRSKSVDEFRDVEIDIAASVCQNSAKSICSFCSAPSAIARPMAPQPALPKAKKFIHKPFRDPSDAEGGDEEKLRAFRKTRDEIIVWLAEEFGCKAQ